MASGREGMNSIWRSWCQIHISDHGPACVCACVSTLMYNGNSKDEDVNVLVYVRALRSV